MSRPLRIQYPGAWYHVMNRGNARQEVFLSQKDYETFLNLLGESVELWKIRIHAFSLLPNHYHLLIETPLGNLSRAMRHIDGVYTQRFNRTWKRDGHLFRGRFRAILVEEDAYLVGLLRYIHLNPVLAGLIKQPQEHPWTSHRNYLGGNKACSWLTTDFLLRYFGRRLSKAKRKLHEFVLEGVPVKLLGRLQDKRWPSVLGSDIFKEWVQSNFVSEQENRYLQFVDEKPDLLKEPDVRQILCNVFGKTWEEIKQGSNMKAKMYRRIALQCYRRYLNFSYQELSKCFGGLHPSTISRIVNQKTNLATSANLRRHLYAELENAKVKT